MTADLLPTHPLPTHSMPAPVPTGSGVVRPEWIDENDHMNLAYYVVLFDLATVELFHSVGCADDYQQTTGCGQFAVESHLQYQNELRLGDEVVLASWVLGGDGKRAHLAHEMRRADDGSPVATQELMFLNVSLTTRRVAPWPDDVRERLAAAAADHARAPRPAWVGRRIAMPGYPVSSD